MGKKLSIEQQPYMTVGGPKFPFSIEYRHSIHKGVVNTLNLQSSILNYRAPPPIL